MSVCTHKLLFLCLQELMCLCPCTCITVVERTDFKLGLLGKKRKVLLFIITFRLQTSKAKVDFLFCTKPLNHQFTMTLVLVERYQVSCYKKMMDKVKAKNLSSTLPFILFVRTPQSIMASFHYSHLSQAREEENLLKFASIFS